MATENAKIADEHQDLEEKIADLHLQDKGDALPEAAQGYVNRAKEVPKTIGGEAEEKLAECKEKVSVPLSKEPKEEEKPKETQCEATHEVAESREVQIAKEEVAESPDKGAYVVPSVDHRSYAEPGGQEKQEDVSTAIVHENADTTPVVHENADPTGKEQQQGKGIIQSVTGKISQSVRSVFSGITGSKSGKNQEVKSGEVQK